MFNCCMKITRWHLFLKLNALERSRREEKIGDAEEPVDAKMQSNVGGIAAGGTSLKQPKSEETKKPTELISVEAIFTS